MKLVISNLTKSYGSTLVLDDLSFTFEQGRMYGLLGRNGSGKTTLFNCVDGLIDYEKGEAYIEHDDGSREELEGAGASHIAETAEEIGRIILS